MTNIFSIPCELFSYEYKHISVLSKQIQPSQRQNNEDSRTLNAGFLKLRHQNVALSTFKSPPSQRLTESGQTKKLMQGPQCAMLR